MSTESSLQDTMSAEEEYRRVRMEYWQTVAMPLLQSYLKEAQFHTSKYRRYAQSIRKRQTRGKRRVMWVSTTVVFVASVQQILNVYSFNEQYSGDTSESMRAVIRAMGFVTFALGIFNVFLGCILRYLSSSVDNLQIEPLPSSTPNPNCSSPPPLLPDMMTDSESDLTVPISQRRERNRCNSPDRGGNHSHSRHRSHSRHQDRDRSHSRDRRLVGENAPHFATTHISSMMELSYDHVVLAANRFSDLSIDIQCQMIYPMHLCIEEIGGMVRDMYMLLCSMKQSMPDIEEEVSFHVPNLEGEQQHVEMATPYLTSVRNSATVSRSALRFIAESQSPARSPQTQTHSPARSPQTQAPVFSAVSMHSPQL